MRLLAIGIDKSVADPASAAAKRQAEYYVGWDVDILVLAVGERQRVKLNPGLRVYVSGGANKIQAFLNGRQLMKELTAKKRYDVVTGQDFSWSGMLAHSAAHRLGCGLHLQDHSGFFARPRAGIWEQLLYPISKGLALKADRIRTVSRRGKDGLERIGVRGKRINVIPIATDSSRFSGIAIPAGKANVVCIARLEKEKGVDLLLGAWGEVIKSVPEAKLRIVGDGSLRNSLEQQVVDAGIKGSVEFVGKQADVREHLEWANIAVQPSWFEGWGLSVVEAAAAGRPVVMTDVGCAGEIIKDGESGIVVPVGDMRQLAAAMIGLLKDKSLRDEFGKRAKELAYALPDPEMAISANRASLEDAAKGAGYRQKTLICAQAVDEGDPLFGFFVPWLRKFAEHGDAIVCALRVSDPLPHLPPGIEVRPTRKAGSKSKLGVILNVAKISWTERADYQSVFIRGDAQYLACLGWLWRLMGKKVVFWYTHYAAKNPWFWLAVPWANDVVTAVPESNPLKSALLIGHHLDTGIFKPRGSAQSARPRVLLFGRVSQVKRVAWMVKVLSPFVESGKIELTVIGKETDAASGEELKSVLPKQAKWEERDVPSHEASGIYRDFDIFINATPGSMDKTILEAAASGLTVLAATRGLLRGLPENLHWLRFEDEEGLMDSLERAVSLSSDERDVIGSRLRDWVIRQHSMDTHLLKLSALLHELRPRRPMKQTLKIWLHRLGFRNFGGGLSVVMFHSFDGQGAASWDRNRLISWLVRAGSAGYAFDDLKEAQSHVLDTSPNSGKILVTVDDATADLLDALDAFRMAGIKPLVFVPSRTKEIETSDGYTRKVIPSENLSELVREGSVDVGAHGQTHANLTGLEPGALEQEIKGSYADVRDIKSGQAVSAFAYPRGKNNKEVRGAVRAAGFTQAFTVEPGTWTAETDPYAIPRITVMGWMSSRDLMTLIKSS